MEEMDSVLSVTSWIKKFGQKHKSSLISVIIPIVITIVILFQKLDGLDFCITVFNFTIKASELVKEILIFINFFVWAVIIIYHRKKLRNKTTKFGIGLIFMESIGDNAYSRKLLIKLLKEELKDNYEIKVYDKDEIKVYINKDNKIKNKIFKDLNLWSIIKIEELTIGIDAKKTYRLDVQELYVNFFGLTKKSRDIFQKNFCKDADHFMKEYIDITYGNNFQDSKNGAKILHIILNYVLILTYLLSPEPYKAYQLIEELAIFIKSTNINDDQVKYISNGLPFRLLDAYVNNISWGCEQTNRFEEKDDKKYCISLIDRYEECYRESLDVPCVNHEEYEWMYQETKKLKIELLIELDELSQAQDCINSLYSSDDILYLLFQSLIESKKSNYQGCYNLIKKINKRKDTTEEIRETICKISEYMYTKNKGEFWIKFNYAVVNKFFGKKETYNKLKKDLSEQSDIKKYLK